MTRFLQQFSGFCFYVLGLSFFVAYALLQKGMGGLWPAWWLQTADLPLAFTSIVYGGLSVYVSMKRGDKPAIAVACLIGIPLAAFFVFLVVLNFWGVIAR